MLGADACYGVERRELSHNVAASMKKVRVRREMATYTPDEIRQVFALPTRTATAICGIWR